MGIAIDTSALIELERRGVSLVDSIADREEDIFIPTPVVAELWIGIELADSPARKASRLKKVEALLGVSTVLPFDAEVAPTYAKIYRDLRSSGTLIPSSDLAIAAITLHFGHEILVGSRDEAHFRAVRELEVIVLGME